MFTFSSTEGQSSCFPLLAAVTNAVARSGERADVSSRASRYCKLLLVQPRCLGWAEGASGARLRGGVACVARSVARGLVGRGRARDERRPVRGAGRRRGTPCAGAGRGSEELSVPVFSSRVTYTHEAVDSVARLGLTPSFAGRRRLKRPGPSPGVWWGEACTPAGLCRTGGCLHVLTPVPRRRCGRRSPCLVIDGIPRALCWFITDSFGAAPVNNCAVLDAQLLAPLCVVVCSRPGV